MRVVQSSWFVFLAASSSLAFGHESATSSGPVDLDNLVTPSVPVEIGAVGLSAERGANAQYPAISLNSLLDLLAKTVCVTSNGANRPGLVFGNMETCGPQNIDPAIEEALMESYQEASGLLVAIPGVFSFMQPETSDLLRIEDGEQRQEAVRSAFLRSGSIFRRVMVPRLEAALAERGFVCGDCPRLEPAPEREVGYRELLPYISAFLWIPSDVSPAEKSAADKPVFRLRTCAGDNGLAALPHDALLARAGMYCAFAVREIALRAFRQLVLEPSLAELPSNASRVVWLRKALREQVAASSEVKSGIRGALESARDVLGVKLVETAEEQRDGREAP